jgi:hypothetical protein
LQARLGTEQSLEYSIKIMGDHVKLKSMCCSYNIDFKSPVIKMQKEITTSTWLGNSMSWNRVYSVGKKKRDY